MARLTVRELNRMRSGTSPYDRVSRGSRQAEPRESVGFGSAFLNATILVLVVLFLCVAYYAWTEGQYYE